MTNGELMRAVAAWAKANYPGCPVEYVSIHLRYLATPIQLPMPPFAAAPRPIEETERGTALARCKADVLAVLRAAGRSLSRTLILMELESAGHKWSASTVNQCLAELAEDGTIENPENSRRYRLAGES